MPRADLKTCRHCDRHVDECGVLSHQRLCERCARERLTENIVGIKTKTGIAYRRQIIGIVSAALGDPHLVNMLADAGAFPPVDRKAAHADPTCR